MNVFEIDERLAQIVNGSLDEETGEVNFTDEALAEIEALNIKRDEAVEYFCLASKNDEAFEKAIDDEMKILKDKKDAVAKRRKRRNEFIKTLLAGQKFVTPKISATFRTTHDVVKFSMNEKELKAFFIDNKMFDFLKKTEEYDISKTAIKEAIKAGETVPYTTLEDSVSMTIK